MKCEARSIQSLAQVPSSDLRSGKTSLDSEERAMNELSGWKGVNVMEVQVDTKVEIRRGSWDDTEPQGVRTMTQIEGGRK